MLKSLAALLILTPAAAHAFSTCDLTDIGGPGASIVEEASNPVVSGKWVYAAYTKDTKVVVLVATNSGATQQPLQTIFDQDGPSSNVRVAASGEYLYVTWLFGPRSDSHIMLAVNSKHGDPKSWSAPVDLGAVHHSLHQISADGNNVHIAFVGTDNHTGVVSSSDNGHTFGPSIDLGKGDGEVVVTGLGQDVYVAWEVGKNSVPGIDFAVSHDGGSTFTVSNISDNGVRHAHEPIFSLNQRIGRLSLVWREDNPLIGTYLQSNDHGNTWSAPVTIDQSSRQFMVQDLGKNVYITYLKNYPANSQQDWQVQVAISSDGGRTFPNIQNLSGPTGISKIVGDNARPVPWADGGQVAITGIMVDGAYIWSGQGTTISTNSVYLGPGELAAPQGSVALWQQPEGVVTYAYCH